MPQGSVWWCAQQAASMCIGLQARDGWWCTIPISLCVVSKCYASWCNLCKLHYLHSLKVATGEKGPRPGPLICGLCSNAEFQPCEPPMWPRFFVSNFRIYSHGRAGILRPLWTCALPYFTNYTAWKCRLQKQDDDLPPKFATYALIRGFSHTSHQCGHDSLSPITIYTVADGLQYCNHFKGLCDGVLSRELAWYTIVEAHHSLHTVSLDCPRLSPILHDTVLAGWPCSAASSMKWMHIWDMSVKMHRRGAKALVMCMLNVYSHCVWH